MGELPLFLMKNIVNRKRLVPHRGVRAPRLADLDRREILTKRLAEVPEPVVAREEAVREPARAAIELQREGMQVVVDRAARFVERQAALVRAPAGGVEAQYERVRPQIAPCLQGVPAEPQPVSRANVPV